MIRLLILLLVVAACGQPAAGSVAPSPTTSEVAVAATVRDFQIVPDEIRAVGSSFSVAVTNEGPTPHNLTIRDAARTIVGASPELRTGQTATVPVTIDPGSYVLFCSLPGHESLGMRATLVIVSGS